jgi:flagellar hook-length control protein FliK
MDAPATCKINTLRSEPSAREGNSRAGDPDFDGSLKNEQTKLEEKQRMLSSFPWAQFQNTSDLSPLKFDFDFLSRSLDDKVLSIERDLQSDGKKAGSTAQTLQAANGEAKAQAKEQEGAAKISLIIDQNDFIKNIVANSKYAVGEMRSPVGLSNARSLNFGSVDLDLIISELVDKIKMVKEGQKTSLSLSLKPDEAGELLLNFSMKNGVVFISILADERSRHWLESNIGSLEESLKRANVTLGGLSVSSDGRNPANSRYKQDEQMKMFNVLGLSQKSNWHVKADRPVENNIDYEKFLKMMANGLIFFKA